MKIVSSPFPEIDKRKSSENLNESPFTAILQQKVKHFVLLKVFPLAVSN